jgi:hypothetical protein
MAGNCSIYFEDVGNSENSNIIYHNCALPSMWCKRPSVVVSLIFYRKLTSCFRVFTQNTLKVVRNNKYYDYRKKSNADKGHLRF